MNNLLVLTLLGILALSVGYSFATTPSSTSTSKTKSSITEPKEGSQADRIEDRKKAHQSKASSSKKSRGRGS